MPFEPTPPEVDVPSLDTTLDGIIATLTAHNINLTKKERSSAGSVDVNREPFILDYYGNKNDYPTLKPDFMNEPDADNHHVLATDLKETVVKVNRIEELVTDIQINSEHFEMEYGHEGYAVVGRAKEKNVPGADTFYDLLSRHFTQDPGTPPPGE
jgi:hypothetical protein